MAEFGSIVSRCLLESQSEVSQQGIIAFTWAKHGPKKPGMTLKWFRNAVRDSEAFPRKNSIGKPSGHHESFSKRSPFYETEADPQRIIASATRCWPNKVSDTTKKNQIFCLRQMGPTQLYALCSCPTCPKKAYHRFKMVATKPLAALKQLWMANLGPQLKAAWIWSSSSYHQNGFESQSLILQWAS